MSKLTHLDATGNAHMVDVSDKHVTSRSATAKAQVLMLPETLALINGGTAKKGDVLATARIAGIMAAKKTHELIPLCHPLLITKVSVDFVADEKTSSIEVSATVRVEGKTGVEMEALTACSIAALTLYDMCKAVDRGMKITDLRLTEKSGGKSGTLYGGIAMALLPVEEARARILAGVKPLPPEDVSLAQALGRVLAKPLGAKRDQPPFNASAMDGYAVRSEDNATELTVIGTSAAGHAFKGKLKSGEAVRIFTGAACSCDGRRRCHTGKHHGQRQDCHHSASRSGWPEHPPSWFGFSERRNPAARRHPLERPRYWPCRRDELRDPQCTEKAGRGGNCHRR